MILKFVIAFLPWFMKRYALQRWYGYDIHEKARIGIAWIYPRKLIMHEGATIGHFSIAIHLDCIHMENHSYIGRGNWITGFPTNTSSLHFKHQDERISKLYLDEYASITKNHHFDCTNLIEIGKFATIGGYASQFLTHSINTVHNRQDSMPIRIGEYTFVGTNVVVLGGSVLPDYSILGAKSLLNKAFDTNWTLYAGVPAQVVKEINKDSKYFYRKVGFVF